MNKTVLIVALALAALPVLMIAPPASGDPVTPADLTERHVLRPPGVEKDLNFFFGPFEVPPGQDRNLVTVDLPLHSGFITKIAPNLIDATTGEEPSDLEMHIHHAHWFRISNDPGDEYYTLNLAWVFGTGEEKTQGSVNARSDAEPGGPRYGIYIPGGQPQSLIFMLHNKGTAAKSMYIVLETSFVYGTRDQIRAATGCGPILLEDEVCSAGKDFHELKGRLWGSTFDVPRDFDASGDGIYVHPRDIATPNATLRAQNALGRMFVAPYNGTAIASAGHMHPNGRFVAVANLGPEGSGCEADLDGDGFPGTTLYYSDKIDRFPEAGKRSEEYQMGATQFGWRAPIRAGDRITQFGVYENGEAASYEAMSYVGIYIDRLQVPPPRAPGCSVDAMKPVLVDDPAGDPRVTIVNHEWHDHVMPYCGFGGWPACDRQVPPLEPGELVDAIHIAGFAYLPGDQNVDLGAGLPRVAKGTPLLVVNEDAALGIRHTITTCPWPCNGPYVANYPQPDGVLDTGKLGNTDYIDGAFWIGATPPYFRPGDDMAPYVTLDTSKLETGKFSYYCRIHPTMRGWFEVVEPQA